MSNVPSIPSDFDSSSVRGGTRGAKLGKTRAGQWWFVASSGECQVLCGLHGVDATVGTEAADHQAKRWGFNLLMPPTAPAFLRKGADHLHNLALNHAGPQLVREEGVLLPDVFASNWSESVEQRINGVEPVAGLIGWTIDTDWRWGGWAEPDQPLARAGLLQVCLSLDPAFRAYHSAWDFVLARHGGDLEKVATDWGMKFSGRGAARQMTREEKVMDSPGYRRDLTDFVREFAQRYLSGVHAAARQINPDCLIVSPLLTSATPPAVRAIAASQCDLLQVAAPGLVEADAPQLWQISSWPEVAPGVDPASGEGPFERRIRQGRELLVAGLRDPSIIGYSWGRFRAGDLATHNPFSVGLVDENRRSNDALVEPLSAVNAVATQIRAGESSGA